jgi:TetR/AcrR family transcriptional repressor of mexJK operon
MERRFCGAVEIQPGTNKSELTARGGLPRHAPDKLHHMRDTQKYTVRTRPGAGRPTREQAGQRHMQLLDCALDLFLEKGLEHVTMDAIAASVRMTKRTVYGLYEDKKALFKAAVQRAVERQSVPVTVLRAVETSDLEATLRAVARIRLANVMTPAGLRLQRIIHAESFRFPEIYRLAYEQGTLPTIDYLTDLFRRHTKAGAIRITKPEMAATAFLTMVIGAPVRAIVWGGSMTEDEIEQRIHYSVQLFLDGARRR